MSKSFHFLQGTKVVGPLQLDELKSLIQKGVVSEQTMLSDDSNSWKPATELVPQLFGQRTNNSGGQSKSSGAEQWYVKSNGQQYGPISYTELLGWTGSGSVIAETLIRKSENGAWQRADTVFPHLGVRSVTPRTSKPKPEQPQFSSLAIRTDAPKPPVHQLEPVPKESDAGNDIAMTVFALIGAIAVGYAFVQGFIQFKAAFGFFGIFAVWMLFNFVRGLSKMARRL